jgi:hypothetical protein
MRAVNLIELLKVDDSWSVQEKSCTCAANTRIGVFVAVETSVTCYRSTNRITSSRNDTLCWRLAWSDLGFEILTAVTEEFCLLGNNAAWHLLSRWFLVWLIFLTLKMKMTCSSEISVDFHWTAHRYIPEDRILSACFVLLTLNLLFDIYEW